MSTPQDSTPPASLPVNSRRRMEQELRRPEQVGDEWVELGNGERWRVPSLDVFPLTLHFAETDDGKIEASETLDAATLQLAADVRRVFDEIYEASQELKRDSDAEPSGGDFMFAASVVYRLLATNYKLTPDLVNMTGLIQTSHVVPVILAAYGQKKKATESATSSTSESPSPA